MIFFQNIYLINLTLCLPGRRARGKGCFQVEKRHIKMETNLGSFQRSAQSTDSLELERPVHQKVLGNSETQTASNLQWNSPVKVKHK